ncbi:MAG: UDP-N-acetylmuramoyl-tripeptide--D-alanyl-D-alanine ligase [Lysobacteraceae bacterium]|nr:MAG: UDP-N-acetylmuramoyl-tripeptide--D-alanyl-D-alanine ligase [Xanthomonadaceae bacterium]
MTLSRIARAVNGRLIGVDVEVDHVVTDTRNLSVEAASAGLYVALKGDNFDGHDYVAQAAVGGARAALVSRPLALDLPQVVVADTQLALADLAASVHRERDAKVIAITGSNGKTSVKALTTAILERAGRAYATPGNRNNEIGMPLTVLDAPEDAQFAVYEMGSGAPGDIAYLTRIAPPHVALVNNVAPAHIERMGSLLGIADTKAAVYDDLVNGGVAVINADDAFAPFFAERAHGHRIIRFGLEAGADVTARDIALNAHGSRFVLITPEGEAEVELAMPGRHNVANALAAASLALGAGASLQTITEGLNAARPVAGRLISHMIAPGVVLIDDSYNANPGSLKAAIETMASLGGERWLVLGDMRELGDDGVALHAEVGRRARDSGIARLYALGALSAAAAEAFGEGAQLFETHAALAERLRADLDASPRAVEAGAIALRVLVKGSRGSAMDRIVAAVLATQATTAGGGQTHAA